MVSLQSSHAQLSSESAAAAGIGKQRPQTPILAKTYSSSMSLPLLLSIHKIKLLNVSLLHISEAQNCSIISYFQPRLSVEWDAFEDSSSQGKEASLSWNRIPVNGTVTIKNTVEAFKVPLVFLFGCSSFAVVLVLLLFLLLLFLLLLMSSSLLLTFPCDDPYNASQAADKAAFIQQEGSRLWEDILQDRWRENPDRLVR